MFVWILILHISEAHIFAIKAFERTILPHTDEYEFEVEASSFTELKLKISAKDVIGYPEAGSTKMHPVDQVPNAPALWTFQVPTIEGDHETIEFDGHVIPIENGYATLELVFDFDRILKNEALFEKPDLHVTTAIADVLGLQLYTDTDQLSYVGFRNEARKLQKAVRPDSVAYAKLSEFLKPYVLSVQIGDVDNKIQDLWNMAGEKIMTIQAERSITFADLAQKLHTERGINPSGTIKFVAEGGKLIPLNTPVQEWIEQHSNTIL